MTVYSNDCNSHSRNIYGSTLYQCASTREHVARERTRRRALVFGVEMIHTASYAFITHHENIPPTRAGGVTVYGHGRKFARRALGLTQSKIREVTRRVEAVGGVNLGQGTCALPPDPRVVTAAHKALDEGHHSYTLFDGVAPLKTAIVDKYGAYNGMAIGEDDVLVTLGATGGLECACKCFIEEGDECVLFEPTYQYHVKLVLERGGVPRFVRLCATGGHYQKDLSMTLTNASRNCTDGGCTTSELSPSGSHDQSSSTI